MQSMFADASNFDQSIGGWNISNLGNGTDMFLNAGLSKLNYDTLLIDWEAKTHQPNLSFNGGISNYCIGSPARSRLQNIDGWTISDGGEICPTSCNLGLASGSNSGATEYEACDELRVDGTFTAQSTADITLGAGTSITFYPGFTVEVGGILDAKVCGQSLCEVSAQPMEYGCSPCVTKICNIDTFCCGAFGGNFDSNCKDAVGSACSLLCD